MNQREKNKSSGKKRSKRLWGVDAIALGFLAIAALMVQAALGVSGAPQAWAVFVASGSAAAGLGLLLRYTPARQVVMLACAMVVVVEVVVFARVTQPEAALADVASAWSAWSAGEAAPSAAPFARLAAAVLFLLYLARPRTARAFRR